MSAPAELRRQMLFLRGPYGEEKTFALVPTHRDSDHIRVAQHVNADDEAERGISRWRWRSPQSAGAPNAKEWFDLLLIRSQFEKGHFHYSSPPRNPYCNSIPDAQIPETTRRSLHEEGLLAKGLSSECEAQATTSPASALAYRLLGLDQASTMPAQTMSATHSNGTNGLHVNGGGGLNGASDIRHGQSRSPTRDSHCQTTFDDVPSPKVNGHKRIPMHQRKESNPLAPPFIVSAPGKTIVYGEHAVVHGKAAIAAAISLRSYLLCTTLSKSQRTISLRFTDIGLDHTWNIKALPWKEFAPRKKKYYDLVTTLDKELVEAMKPHIDPVSPDVAPDKRKVHHAAASAFLYLFMSLGSEHSPGCIYAMRSTIPIGAGLGSSASVSVCIAAALLIQCRALSGPHPDQQSEEAEKQLERINRWAFVGEMLIHGNPSGVDNTVATNGHAVLFQRKDYSKPPSVSVLRDFPELPLLLIDTCQPKSTAAEVAKVQQLKSLHPLVVDNTLAAIDAITRSVYERITSDDFDPHAKESIAHLGELMSINHGLLTSLGVSHPRLERLRYLVDQAGVGWTKLTGAGGGGCAITLLKPPEEKDVNGDLNGEAATTLTPMEELDAGLKSEGFIKYTTTLGGDGVGVLYPAVINDAEIDQDMFLTADGREELGELVDPVDDRDAWKYWRP